MVRVVGLSIGASVGPAMAVSVGVRLASLVVLVAEDDVVDAVSSSSWELQLRSNRGSPKRSDGLTREKETSSEVAWSSSEKREG